MIKTPTVFVLGAGASIPYGFPSARDLKKTTLKSWSDDRKSIKQEIIDGAGFPFEQYDAFHHDLQMSRSLSVDAFLEHRPEFIPIGKAIMAWHLCQCENPNKLFGTDIEDDWLQLLVHRMTETCDDIEKNNVSFITFNYDRSLEHALFAALQSGYGKAPEDVAVTMRSIPIVHVHGQLGYLPWQDSDDSAKVRKYIPDNTWEYVSKAAKGIKIICENMDGTAELCRAHELLERAQRIYFLGFGYADTNMDRLLKPFQTSTKIRMPIGVWAAGTCKGLTNEERERVEQRCENLKLTRDYCEQWGCLDFLRRQSSFLSG